MTDKLRVLSLFAGIGGMDLGLERTGGFQTVAFCEIEEFPRRVLAKHWPKVPQYHDVRELSGARLAADGIAVDVICGGYPCQPFSVAGKQLGQEDDRHLWPEYKRLIQELRPLFVIGENVVGHVTMGLDDVLLDLENCGYTARAFIIPACAINAIHRRDRAWILAYSNSIGTERLQRELAKLGECGQGRQDSQVDSNGISADTNGFGSSGQGRTEQQVNSAPDTDWQERGAFHALRRPTESPIRGRNDGVSGRVDRHRLKALGNSVVPQIPELIGHAILDAIKSEKAAA